MSGKYFPLKLFLAYIVITLGVSFWGPIEYINYSKITVFVYMLFFLFFFILGYFLGGTKKIHYKKLCTMSFSQIKVLNFVRFCVIAVFLVKLFQAFMLINSGSVNFSISGSGAAYHSLYADYERNSGSYSASFILNIFLQFPLLVAMILGVFYFKEIGRVYSYLVVFLYALIFFIHVLNEGKQKQFGDMLIFLGSVSMIKMMLLNSKRKKVVFNRLLALSLLSVVILMAVINSRYSEIGVNLQNINEKIHHMMHFKKDHLVFSVFGEEWGYLLAVLGSYLSQGYYGLSMCLQLPFVWTNFFGHSYSMMVVYNQFLGGDFLLEKGYLMRMETEYGWDAMSKWHTIFPWLASDFTFSGAIIIFSLVAYVYAISWRESVRFQNPFSILIFTLLTLGLIFVPANNQLLHTPESYFSTAMSFFLWLFFRKKYNLVIEKNGF